MIINVMASCITDETNYSFIPIKFTICSPVDELGKELQLDMSTFVITDKEDMTCAILTTRVKPVGITPSSRDPLVISIQNYHQQQHCTCPHVPAHWSTDPRWPQHGSDVAPCTAKQSLRRCQSSTRSDIGTPCLRFDWYFSIQDTQFRVYLLTGHPQCGSNYVLINGVFIKSCQQYSITIKFQI